MEKINIKIKRIFKQINIEIKLKILKKNGKKEKSHTNVDEWTKKLNNKNKFKISLNIFLILLISYFHSLPI